VGDIFREIDEELRQEQYEKLWRKYGKYGIAAAVVIVVLVAAFVGWRDYQRTQREAEGMKFNAAVTALEESKTEDAAALLKSLIEEGDDEGYGLLARFQEAGLLARTGDKAAAVSIYDSIARDDAIDQTYRNLALILLAYHSVGSSDSSALTARLEPLAQPGNPWRFSALEVLGYISQRAGDTEKAKEYFQRITDDVDAPSNLRARAAQLLDMIGG
jgi:hypothetical protein